MSYMLLQQPAIAILIYVGYIDDDYINVSRFSAIWSYVMTHVKHTLPFNNASAF